MTSKQFRKDTNCINRLRDLYIEFAPRDTALLLSNIFTKNQGSIKAVFRSRFKPAHSSVFMLVKLSWNAFKLPLAVTNYSSDS